MEVTPGAPSYGPDVDKVGKANGPADANHRPFFPNLHKYPIDMRWSMCVYVQTRIGGVCPRPNILAIQTLSDGVNPSRDLIRDGT